MSSSCRKACKATFGLLLGLGVLLSACTSPNSQVRAYVDGDVLVDAQFFFGR